MTKTILFYSPQGGSGKTMISINFAVMASAKLKTLMIDMTTFGDIYAYLMAQNSQRDNLVDLLKESCTTELFKENLINIVNKNLFVVHNNDVKTSLKLRNSYEISRILDFAKRLEFDLIVVDTSPELHGKNKCLFENTDQIIIPVTEDMAAICNVSKFKKIIEMNFQQISLNIILNKCKKTSNFDENILNQTGIQNIMKIPLYTNFQKYIDQGRLISSGFHNNAYKDFSELTDKILANAGF